MDFLKWAKDWIPVIGGIVGTTGGALGICAFIRTVRKDKPRLKVVLSFVLEPSGMIWEGESGVVQINVMNTSDKTVSLSDFTVQITTPNRLFRKIMPHHKLDCWFDFDSPVEVPYDLLPGKNVVIRVTEDQLVRAIRHQIGGEIADPSWSVRFTALSRTDTEWSSNHVLINEKGYLDRLIPLSIREAITAIEHEKQQRQLTD